MKTVLRTLILSIVATLSVSAAFADLQPLVRGEFRIEPKIMHSGPITGQIQLMFDKDVFKQVLIKPDAPVFGMSEFHSSNQWFNKIEANGKQQLAVVYQLEGPPHGWYFVLIASSAEGVTYDGVFYRVGAKVTQIQDALKNGVAFGADGKPVVPPRWRKIGAATVKY